MMQGFICERTHEPIPFNDCLECAKSRINRKLDCPFDEATIAGMIFHQKNKTDISVTMISGCHRGVFIQRHYDFYVYPSQLYWAFRGQIAHKIMEESDLHDDAVVEKRFVKKWDGIEISGTPDIIIPGQKVLKDYKTTKQVPTYLNKDGVVLAWDNHRTQLNLYRWLAPYDIETMEVIYFSMEETLICPVRIWPEESKKKSVMTIDRHLKENLVPLKMALDSETMPPYARCWQCDEYCTVSGICYRELKKEISASRHVIPIRKGGKKNAKNSTVKKGRKTDSAA
ncbi:hypothetical protein ACFLZM_00815 [Thermodesulfobacteriota bacterium]